MRVWEWSVQSRSRQALVPTTIGGEWVLTTLAPACRRMSYYSYLAALSPAVLGIPVSL